MFVTNHGSKRGKVRNKAACLLTGHMSLAKQKQPYVASLRTWAPYNSMEGQQL